MTRDYAAPDWRGLCLRMADELDHYRQLLTDDCREVHPLAAEARAALAQPEPEVVGPELTDQELLAVASGLPFNPDDDDILLLQRSTIAADRARWGRPAPAPAAAGEVGELARWLRENADSAANVDHHEPAALLPRARAALAQPEPEVVGPTDEELLATLDKATADFPPRHPEAEALNAVEYPLALELRKARAVLARWGNHFPDVRKMVGPAPAPAGERQVAPVPVATPLKERPDFLAGYRAGLHDGRLEHLSARPAPVPAGEVAEFVAWLRSLDLGIGARAAYSRAADLLERQAAPVPVAVSERLPQPEDCDAEGRCWVHQPHEVCPESAAWELMSAKYASANYGAVCWLPAHALPLPTPEPQP